MKDRKCNYNKKIVGIEQQKNICHNCKYDAGSCNTQTQGSIKKQIPQKGKGFYLELSPNNLIILNEQKLEDTWESITLMKNQKKRNKMKLKYLIETKYKYVILKRPLTEEQTQSSRISTRGREKK